MRIHIIACNVLFRELSHFAVNSPEIVSVSWLPQGLHNTPDKLRQRVQETLTRYYEDIQNETVHYPPDYIALGYGLCSNGVVGVEAGDYPIVVPRTDDCIALFLGSQKRYLDLFETRNGAYWLNNGWIEACGTLVRQQETKEQRWQKYAEKYGEDNADFLIEQESGWIAHYDTCEFIRSSVFDRSEYWDMAKRVAAENAWQFDHTDGNERMLEALTRGTWTDEEYLICPPHHRIEADYSGRKLKAVPIEKA